MTALPQGATWVRFPRFVGDAAMQMPVLRLLREVGAGPLVVWGPKATVSLVEGTDLCDGILFDEGKPSVRALARTLRAHKAARSVHFPKSLRPALAAFLARVPERIGVNESLAGLFNTVSGPFWDAEGPFLLRYGAVLKKAFPGAGPMPFADYDPGLRVDAPEGPYVCLMPGSTWPSKSWPPAIFAPSSSKLDRKASRWRCWARRKSGISARRWRGTRPETWLEGPRSRRPRRGCAAPPPPWATTRA